MIEHRANASFYHGKKILVAGGTGTIGIPVVRRLVDMGAEVTVASLDPYDYAGRVLPVQANFTRIDLTDLAHCLRMTEGMDMVCNLLTIKGSVGTGESRAASYWVPMVWFQTNLMEAAFRHRVDRFLFVGSICSYPPADTPKGEDSMWNGLPRQSDRFTGLVKRMAEIQGEAYYVEHDWDAVRIIRPCNVYGPYDDFNPKTAQVIPALIGRMLEGENPVSVWGDGTAVRDFIFSDELAEWLLVALEQSPGCRPLNLSSGKGHTIREVAETIANCIEPRPRIEWDPTKPTGDPVRLLKVELAEKLIGFRSDVTLQQGIHHTVDWLRQNRQIAACREYAAQ